MELQQTEVKNGKEGLHINVAQMCVTAVLMALTCVATMVVQIPIPLGYAHLGDSVILISAYFFGPVVGIFNNIASDSCTCPGGRGGC